MEIYPLYDETTQLRQIHQFEAVNVTSDTDRAKADLYDRMRLQWLILSNVGMGSVTLSGAVFALLLTRALDAIWLGGLLVLLGVAGVAVWLILSWSESGKLQKIQGFCALSIVGLATAISFHDLLFYAWVYYNLSVIDTLFIVVFWGVAGAFGLTICVFTFCVCKAFFKRKWRGY